MLLGNAARLWEMDPDRLLRLGPGGAALFWPAEKTTLPLIGQAASRIQRATRGDLRFCFGPLLSACRGSVGGVRHAVQSEAGEAPMASAKQVVIQVLKSLPDDCSLEDVQYELYVRQKVAEGERAADRGETVPHDEVMREAREWLRKL